MAPAKLHFKVLPRTSCSRFAWAPTAVRVHRCPVAIHNEGQVQQEGVTARRAGGQTRQFADVLCEHVAISVQQSVGVALGGGAPSFKSEK